VDLAHEKDVFPDKATERKILSLAIKCPSDGCDWTGELRNKEIHLASCIYKFVSCTNEDCKMRVPKKDLEEHVTKICLWRTEQCAHCQELHPQCQIEQHIKECKKLPVECGGCGAKMQQEKLLDHAEKACPFAVVACPYHLMGCDEKVQRDQIESHLESAARRHLDLACIKLDKNQEDFKEKTRKLEAKLETLEQLVKEKWNAVQTQLTTDLSAKLDREILKLREESQPFVWKITGFSELYDQAKLNRRGQTTLESGYFFTGSVGYKLNVFLCPNGSGNGKNTHVSVYFQICKAKYDALLSWPFRQTVTFTLIDQQENATDAVNFVRKVVPNPDSNAFARPVTKCNNGWGFPRFISHEELHRRRYIVEDTMFLKVQTSPLA